MNDKFDGLFLLLVIILSNFTGKTIGNNFIKFINDNYIIRLLVIYILIFLTIRYSTEYTDHINHFKMTTYIFCIYLMATKSNLLVLLTVIFLIILNHLINHHIEYLNENKKTKSVEYTNFNYYSDLITKLIAAVTICGFSYEIYLRTKNKNFSFIKYITTQS